MLLLLLLRGKTCLLNFISFFAVGFFILFFFVVVDDDIFYLFCPNPRHGVDDGVVGSVPSSFSHQRTRAQIYHGEEDNFKWRRSTRKSTKLRKSLKTKETEENKGRFEN